MTPCLPIPFAPSSSANAATRLGSISPREDVRMDLLTRSDTVTHCPFKGDAAYFSFSENQDVAWSYEQPAEGIEEIVEEMPQNK